jgi:hypothetical protein
VVVKCVHHEWLPIFDPEINVLQNTCFTLSWFGSADTILE